jgi:ABC-2 type transport system ATP-binding protein
VSESAAGVEPILVVEGLGKRYGERQALREIEFAMHPGEVVAVIGPNGAGKTTLLSILAGIQEPTTGTVNRGVGEIGWVPQQPALYTKLSVLENLKLFARLERIPDVDGMVTRMLEQTGLAERAHERVERLSGGNRQRVNVALGLLANPPVILLDEPSSSLDPGQRERLWHFIGGLARDSATSVLFSTHILAEAQRHAHRTVVLAEGELVFDGSPAELSHAAGAEDAVDFEQAFLAFLERRGQR